MATATPTHGHRHGRTVLLRPAGRNGLAVSTIHPQVGELHRGRIVPTADGWQPIDCDAEHLDPVAGDFINAERVLLDATAGLDELVPADQLDPEE
jgi:hypothetical protein